jgi:hypothetical protein
LQFGIVCSWPKYLIPQVFNTGTVDLMILGINRVSGSADFGLLPSPATPLAIAPGSQVDFTIEYNPTTRGVIETGTFQIVNDDPVTPFLDVTARGFGGTGALVTVIADRGSFGKCCVGSLVNEDLTLHNNGPCRLSINDVTSSSTEFETPSVSSYPVILTSGASITMPIRFQPASHGPKSATLTVFRDDPGGPGGFWFPGMPPRANWR